MRLYDALAARNARKPTAVRDLPQDQRRDYDRITRSRGRAREREAQSVGDIPATTANVRDALADAALMILATGAPGADQIRAVLEQVFATKPGVPLSVETKAKRGKLKPKLIARGQPSHDDAAIPAPLARS